MKTPGIILAEAALTWFVLHHIEQDENGQKLLATHDDWQSKTGANIKREYRSIVKNSMLILKQNAPESEVYQKAKTAWETYPAISQGDYCNPRQIMPPMGAKTNKKP
jgi:hypothetical protein